MQQALSNWFKEEKRILPWRENLSPYSIWISEVMLQQTQVSVVIPYYERWMRQFPTIKDLAAAPLDTVIKAWEGLGYYSRARHLHAGACYIVENHEGQLPQEVEALAKIKGLGPYTIGAIRSFAFRKKAAAVDGNVLRVLARYFNISDDLSLPRTIKKFWNKAEEILPDHEPWVFTEALIELGATLCMKKPKCMHCPLKMNCQAFRLGTSESLPYKSAKIRAEKLYRSVAVIVSNDTLLIKRVQKGNVMSDLHEFPFFDTSIDGINTEEFIERLQLQFGLTVSPQGTLPEEKHTFTRFHARLFPSIFYSHAPLPISGYEWIPISHLQHIAFSSGHRRVLNHFLQNHETR